MEVNPRLRYYFQATIPILKPDLMATGNYFFKRKFPYIPTRVVTQAEWNEIEKIYGKWRKAENALTVL